MICALGFLGMEFGGPKMCESVFLDLCGMERREEDALGLQAVGILRLQTSEVLLMVMWAWNHNLIIGQKEDLDCFGGRSVGG